GTAGRQGGDSQRREGSSLRDAREPQRGHADDLPYLDLRRPDMKKMMRRRIKLLQSLRRYLDAAGFQDIETPILTKATPEGARDYLVPSRVHPGQFYAL